MEEQTIFSINSILTGINGYENQTPADLIEKSGSRDIFKLIKRGYRFDDEVLTEAHIAREIRDDRVYWEIASHTQPKSKKELKKDTAAYDEIVESLSHVEVEEEEPKNEEEEELEEFFENEDDE